MDAPALPAYLPQRTPVAPFAMQKILSKAMKQRRTNKGGKLHSQVKGADKMGGRIGSGIKSGGRTGTATGGARK